jgi:exonuclease SbcD
MKVLHTSDWHLGRSLYGRRRYDEFTEFLNWLAGLIVTEKIDTLLIAGDIFDTCTPSNKAQELYYQFLCKVSSSCCKNIVVIAGNHDSPSFLNAPKELLKVLNVFVVGAMTEDPADEVILLEDADKQPSAIICAVPYLRDRDIRSVELGESVEDKNSKLMEGLKKHYADVCLIAEAKQQEYDRAGLDVPIIGMGHLFTEGGVTVDGDGVRELYVGTLAHVGEDIFPWCINYMALGHLHVPQLVNNCEHIRYSGSPIPMGYGEAGQDKKIVLINFDGKLPEINEVSIPCFQELIRISGDVQEINNALNKLRTNNSKAWLEIEYTGTEVANNLRQMVTDSVSGTNLEVRRIKSPKITERVINREFKETLEDLDYNDVFVRCLDIYEIEEDKREGLIQTYNEILKAVLEEDSNEF